MRVLNGTALGKFPCTRFVHRLTYCSVSLSHPLPRSFCFLPLLDFAHGLEEGSLLCPVRALSFYLCMTEGHVRRSSALCVSPRAISRNALSFFLREVLSGAGAISGTEGKSVRAHSITSVSTSFSFLRTGRSPRCWLPRLGGPTQFLLPFFLRISLRFLGAFGPWGLLWLQILSCPLLRPLFLLLALASDSFESKVFPIGFLGILSDVVAHWDKSVAICEYSFWW